MKILKIFFSIALATFTFACSSYEGKDKYNAIDMRTLQSDSIRSDSSTLADLSVKPKSVLLTGDAKHRIVPIYKEKYNKRGKYYYIDGTYSHTRYNYENRNSLHNWHDNILPGITAAYGRNMLNLSHYNFETKEKNLFFDDVVLIKTIYYPANSKDTLNGKAINRDYYMVSVYDEDTNGDTLIDQKDLRRFYKFDIEGKNKSQLIPKDYSVFKSEYDSQNDFLYIHAVHDENKNGARERKEAIHIFSINLKEPKEGERIY